MTYSCSSEFWPSARKPISRFHSAGDIGPSKTTDLGLNLFDLRATNIVSAVMPFKKTPGKNAKCSSNLVHRGRHDDCGASRAWKVEKEEECDEILEMLCWVMSSAS